jgi:hypothetical protein
MIFKNENCFKFVRYQVHTSYSEEEFVVSLTVTSVLNI